MRRAQGWATRWTRVGEKVGSVNEGTIVQDGVRCKTRREVSARETDRVNICASVSGVVYYKENIDKTDHFARVALSEALQ